MLTHHTNALERTVEVCIQTGNMSLDAMDLDEHKQIEHKLIMISPPWRCTWKKGSGSSTGIEVKDNCLLMGFVMYMIVQIVYLKGKICAAIQIHDTRES